MLLQLRSKASPQRVEAFIGKHAAPEHAPVVLRGDVDVYKPDGTPLLFVRKAAISEAASELALPLFRAIRKQETMNRGAYAGGLGLRVRADGKQSKTHQSPPVRSVVVGYMDRYERIPYCRETFVTREHPEEWGACLTQIREVAELMKTVVPKRYEAQLAEAQKTHPAYVVPGTPFTTLTVNNTVSGAYHRDAGDFPGGMGVMSVQRHGKYDGCHLVFPAYGIAADLGDRDVILFDSHEVHGNTPFISDGVAQEDYERVSVVYYFRSRMTACLSPAEELERAKALRSTLGTDAPAPSEAPTEEG